MLRGLNTGGWSLATVSITDQLVSLVAIYSVRYLGR